MKHVKKLIGAERGADLVKKVILELNKSEEGSEKRVVFVHSAVFERARNRCVKKFSLSERSFCSRAAFKSCFLQLLMFMGFDYDIVLVLALF